MLIGVIIISAVIVFIEGLPLIKKNMKKEFITLITLLMIAVLLVVQNMLSIPTPIIILNKLLSPIGKTIYKTK